MESFSGTGPQPEARSAPWSDLAIWPESETIMDQMKAFSWRPRVHLITPAASLTPGSRHCAAHDGHLPARGASVEWRPCGGAGG